MKVLQEAHEAYIEQTNREQEEWQMILIAEKKKVVAALEKTRSLWLLK